MRMPIDVGVALGYEEDKGLGPELVLNGDFSAGIANWTASNVVLSVIGGHLDAAANGGAFPQFFQTIAVTVGKTYQYHCEQFNGLTTSYVQLVAQGIGNYIQLNGAGIYDGRIVATAAGFQYIGNLNSATPGDNAQFDNFSLREVQ